MPAATKNIVFEKRSAFVMRLRWLDKNQKPVNLTGWTAKLQVRTAPEATPVLVEASTANGRILLGQTNGVIDIEIPESLITALTVTEAVYDLILTSPASVPRRFIQGKVRVSPGVTQL